MYRLSILLCLGWLFSINVYASYDYELLTQKLNSNAKFVQGLEKLKQRAVHDQSALLPLFRFYCGDFVTSNSHPSLKNNPPQERNYPQKSNKSPKGQLLQKSYRPQKSHHTYKKTQAITKFLKEYVSANNVSESTIESLFAVKKGCHSKGREGGYKLLLILESISATQKFTDAVIQKLLKLTSAQISEDLLKSRQNYTVYYIQIFKNQTKFRHVPDQARQLAIKGINENISNIFTPSLDFMIGQLRYNDKKSEQSLMRILKTSNNPKYKMRTAEFLSKWYERQGELDAFTRKLLVFYDLEKNQDVRARYDNLLSRLAQNKQITLEVAKRIYPMADSRSRKNISIVIMEHYKKKSETAELKEDEIDEVLKALTGPITITWHRANETIVNLEAAGLINKKLHEKLISIYFSPHNRAFTSRALYKVVLDNIPYRNVKDKPKLDKYPDALLLEVIKNSEEYGANKRVRFILTFMQRVNEYQLLPEQVVDRLYSIYSEQDKLQHIDSFFKLFIRYYKATGFINMNVFTNSLGNLGSRNHKLEKEIYAIVSEELQKESSLAEGLYKMASDRTLKFAARRLFLYKLVFNHFDYAAKNLLPLDDNEDELFKVAVWKVFDGAFYRHTYLLDEKILRAATRYPNKEIRHAAWRMLAGYGVSTPFKVKWERKRYRNDVFVGSLLFGGGPLSLIFGSLLFLKNRKGRKEKNEKMKLVRKSIWLLSTLLWFTAVAAGVFFAGMSHSGTPYGFIYAWFGTIFTAYLFIAMVTRISISTVAIAQE